MRAFPADSVGPGVREIRVHARGEYRVLYLAVRADAVYVLHAFVKKARRTRMMDLEFARARAPMNARRRRRSSSRYSSGA